MSENVQKIQREFKALSDPQKAQGYQRFFKTGPGQYAEGDQFLGLTTPKVRELVKKHRDLSFTELKPFIHSPWHEHRSFAFSVLALQFQKADEKTRTKIFEFYLKQKKFLNNWDLIDGTTPQIVGAFLIDKDRRLLTKFARSESLWERRIAVLATFHFIRQNDLKDIFKLAKILLKDEEDLIHKAVGWMLREAGKRDLKKLRAFLDEFSKQMPRTMLRYSIEKLSPKERKKYMQK